MNAKEYLESKGVFGLDTKKRYNEVTEWMEGYAREVVKNYSTPAVSGSFPSREWTNTLIDMPLCYETGAWDGKRSDEVLVEDDEGRRYVARMYSGQMEGSYFAEWISNDGYIINKEIVRWLKIPA